MPFSFKPVQEGEQPVQAPVSSQPSVTSTPALSTTPVSMSFDSRSLEGRGIVEIILIGIFGLSIVATVLLFGYHYYLVSKVESGKAELATFETKLGSLPLEDMRKLSNRLKVINQLVKEHPSVNAAFRILEDSVENQVTYKRFDLHFSDALRTYELQLAATAPNYRSVAEQMDTFKRKPYTKYIPNISISDVRLDENGKVIFALKMPIIIAGVLPEGLLLQPEGVSATSSDIFVKPPVNTTTNSTSTSESKLPSGANVATTTTATTSVNKKP